MTFQMVCRVHHGDELVYRFYLFPVIFSFGASSSVFSSFPLFLSAFFRLPLLALYNVLLRKCASAREKATTLVLGWLQSWGGRGWCALCMASYSAAEIHDIYTDA